MSDTMRGVAFHNPNLTQITEDGLLCDLYGDPYPPEVQRLYQNVLPAMDTSAAALVRNAMNAYGAHLRRVAATPSYSCIHCRDGKDLPPGYVCNRCGADNPSRY